MAKADINLHIGTSYNGEGFKKLNNALKTSGKELKKSSSMVNQVVGQLGQLDNQAGKVVGTIGNLAGSFATMGVVGLILGGITTGFQLISNKVKETKNQVNLLGETIRNRLLSAMGDADAKATLITQKFQKMNESIKRSNSRSQSLEENEALDKISSIRNQHMANRSKMNDEHEYTLDKAKEAYEVGVIREERILEKAKDKWVLLSKLLQAKREEENQTQQQLINLKEKEKGMKDNSTYLYTKENMEKELNRVLQLAKDNPQDGQKWNKEAAKINAELSKLNDENKSEAERLKRASELLTKAEDRHKKVLEELTILEQDMLDAKRQFETTELQYQTSLQALTETFEEQRKQVEKSIAQEEKRLEEETQREAKEKKRKEEEDRRKKEQDDIKRDRKRIYELERQTQKRLEELNPALEKMKKAAEEWTNAAKQAQGKSFSEWTRDQNHQKKNDDKSVNKSLWNIMEARKRKKDVEERIFDRHGNVRKSASSYDVEQWKQLNEFLQLQPNLDDKTKKSALREQERIGKRIFDKNGKLKKYANKQDVEKWKELQKNFVNPSNPVQDLKDAEKEKDKYVKQQADDIKIIKDKLEGLGL